MVFGSDESKKYKDFRNWKTNDTIIELHPPKSLPLALKKAYTQELADIDLRGEDIPHRALTAKRVPGMNLEGATIHGGLTDTDLRGARMDGVQFAGAEADDIPAAHFSGVNMQDAQARNTRWPNFSASQTNMEGADLSGGEFTGRNIHLYGRDNNMRNADFSNASFRAAGPIKFEGTQLDGANFRNAEFGHLTVPDPMHGNVIFDGVSAQGADFTGMKLDEGRFMAIDGDSDFEGARLPYGLRDRIHCRPGLSGKKRHNVTFVKENGQELPGLIDSKGARPHVMPPALRQSAGNIRKRSFGRKPSDG